MEKATDQYQFSDVDFNREETVRVSAESSRAGVNEECLASRRNILKAHAAAPAGPGAGARTAW